MFPWLIKFSAGMHLSGVQPHNIEELAAYPAEVISVKTIQNTTLFGVIIAHVDGCGKQSFWMVILNNNTAKLIPRGNANQAATL